MPRAFTKAEHERIRATLLSVGRARVAETGFRKTSVAELTRAAGISKGAFYLFFESKEALWFELLGAAETETRATLVELIDIASGPPDETLRRFFRALFDAVTFHPMLRALADPGELAWIERSMPAGTFAEARKDDDRFFAGLLERMRRKKIVRSGVPVAAFTAIPAAALALAQGRTLIGEEVFDAFVDLQIEGWVRALTSS